MERALTTDEMDRWRERYWPTVVQKTSIQDWIMKLRDFKNEQLRYMIRSAKSTAARDHGVSVLAPAFLSYLRRVDDSVQAAQDFIAQFAKPWICPKHDGTKVQNYAYTERCMSCKAPHPALAEAAAAPQLGGQKRQATRRRGSRRSGRSRKLSRR
jgi:hypothetical protein